MRKTIVNKRDAVVTRSIFLILAVLVLAAIVAVASGFVHVEQVRDARAPALVNKGGKVTPRAGTTPAFDVQTGSVELGREQRNVAVPTPVIRVNRPGTSAADAPPTANSAN